MRLLELKTAHLEDGQPLDYKNNLILILKNHPQGMSIDEMEKALSIIGTVRKGNGTVALEDADHEYIVKRLEGTRWMVADPATVQFVKDVRDAPKRDANELLAKA